MSETPTRVFAKRTAGLLLLWPIVFSPAHAGANSPETPSDVRLVNDLDKCLHFDPNGMRVVGLSTKFFLTGTLVQNIGSCGCTSRLATYSVLETLSDDEHPVTYERAYGILASPNEVHNSKKFELTLKSDIDISYTGKVSVHISCKPPD